MRSRERIRLQGGGEPCKGNCERLMWKGKKGTGVSASWQTRLFRESFDKMINNFLMVQKRETDLFLN